MPHTGSEAWTHDMGLTKKASWQPWYVGAPRQVAGYVVEYEGLTFATIKGAGHMVGGCGSMGGCQWGIARHCVVSAGW